MPAPIVGVPGFFTNVYKFGTSPQWRNVFFLYQDDLFINSKRRNKGSTPWKLRKGGCCTFGSIATHLFFTIGKLKGSHRMGDGGILRKISRLFL